LRRKGAEKPNIGGGRKGRTRREGTTYSPNAGKEISQRVRKGTHGWKMSDRSAGRGREKRWKAGVQKLDIELSPGGGELMDNLKPGPNSGTGCRTAEGGV